MKLCDIDARLFAAGIESSAYEARVIASHFTGISEARLIAERELELGASDELESAVKRREMREPLQYILGEWDFMGLTFKVTPDCLIPRADTELLCELAITRLPQGGRVLDLCTGSGCIAAAIFHYRRDAHVTALEKYESTADVAQENFKRLADSVRLVIADATSKADAEKHFRGECFDVIVSNPPYVTAEEMSSLEEELSAEPSAALTDGGDGLSFYRAITEIYLPYLKRGGVLAFEHGYTQGEAVRDILGKNAVTLCDLAGNPRVTYITKDSET